MKYLTKTNILIAVILIELIVILHLWINPKTIIQTEIREVEVIKEVVVEVEKIVENEKEVLVEVEVEVEPTFVYEVTSAEREMLARIVYLESNIESFECQKAVASVIINRWQNGYWGDTLEEVIYAKGQFSPAKLIGKTTPTETNYQAVDYVLQYGSTLPPYVMYFRANFGFSKTWKDYEEYININHTYFGYFIKDKNN